MLTGKGGVVKSLLAQVLCTCVALGRPFMGLAVQEMPVSNGVQKGPPIGVQQGPPWRKV